MNNQYFNANYAYPSFQTYRDNVYDREGRFVIADDGFAKGNLDRLIYKPYRNYVVKSPVVNGEKEQLLLKVQKNGFALQEAGMFLDVNPDHQDAIKAFTYYRMEEEKLKNEYERKYGPLCLGSYANDVYPWAWVNGPWPWEVI